MRHDELKGRRALIVDDDPRNAFVLTDVLELYGMAVARAADGRQAMETLDAGKFDVVLMDIMVLRRSSHAFGRPAAAHGCRLVALIRQWDV